MIKNKEIENRFDELFEEMVPFSGKSQSLAGEIIRAAARIVYRFYNDGDKVGVGYGKETCNAPARFLIKNTPDEISDLVRGIWGMFSDKGYEAILEILVKEVVEYIEKHDELKNQDTVDMWTFRDDIEDKDDEEEDEDEEMWNEVYVDED